MPFLSFDSYPLWLNVFIFLLAAGTIWWAGTRLERYAGAISEQTGLGQAFTGMLLLAAATSLPEIATTITAVALLNNPTLAVYNLVGGVALQTGILVAADRTMRQRGALTYFTPQFVLLVEIVGLLFLLQLTIAAVSARGFPSIAGVSLWSVLIFVVYLGLMYLIYRSRGQSRWTPIRADEALPHEQPHAGDEQLQDQNPADDERRSPKRLGLMFLGMSLIVLAGGWFATNTADQLANQTGLGHAFLGATLLALTTSLPEVSTTVAASRHGRFSMAFSNIFGSNAFDISLLFLADLLYRGGTILEGAGSSAVFVAAVAAVMKCIYLWGLLEREDRVVLGIGWDSAAVVVVYVGAMTVLYFIG
jgi:cation:H+ antiporter